MSKTPSYLTLRNGIYYFQFRIPAGFSKSIVSRQSLFRRSTGTGNRREALKIARKWLAIRMQADDFFNAYLVLRESEEVKAVSELKLTANQRVNKELIKEWVDKNWPAELDGKSDRLMETMVWGILEACFASKPYYCFVSNKLSI